MEEQSWEEMNRICQERKRVGQERYAEESRKRLAKIAATKIRTTFIGALAEVEKVFGFLWGVQPQFMTEDQLKMKESLEALGFDEAYFAKQWEEARTAILNNGNNQARALDQEILQYSMTWNRYRMTIPVMTPQDRHIQSGGN